MNYSRLVEGIVDCLFEDTRYHTTTNVKSRLVSIAKKGLEPNLNRAPNFKNLKGHSRGRLFVTGSVDDAKAWTHELYRTPEAYDAKPPGIFRANDVDPKKFAPDSNAMTGTDEYTTEVIPPTQLDVWHADTGFTPVSAHSPELWNKVAPEKLSPHKTTKGQLSLFPKELYTENIGTIVDELLEVEVLPDAYVTKAADGSWEKKEAAPGTASPLSRSGVRSPRVNMGMRRTPTTTFLPFAGFGPAVEEVRLRTGDEDVRLVPGAAESSAVLLKTSPKAKDYNISRMAAYAGKTPHEFASEVGREHLIILGPASKMKAGLETQKAIFGHEAGHILNKDTQRGNSVKTQNLDVSGDEIVAREEKAWKTGNALLKDMGMTFDPHIEKAALHTYYDEHDPAKADISNLNAGEASSLYHLLKQPDSYSKDTFRLGSKTFFGQDHFMKDRFAKVIGEAFLDEITLPKDVSAEGINRGLDRAHAAWAKEMDTTTDLNNPKLAALSDNYVYFDNLMTAAGYPPEVAPQKMQKVLKQAKLQQAIKRK